jgi:thiamine biosynthesis lipoprotein
MGVGGGGARLRRPRRRPGCGAQAVTGRRPGHETARHRDPEDHEAHRDHATDGTGAGSIRERWIDLGFEHRQLDTGRVLDGWLVMSAACSDFRAMGTDVRCIAPASPAFDRAAEVVRTIFEREERRFSRFRGDSELARVNAAAGSWVDVSEPFADVVGFALSAWRRTEGRFDPTLLGAMIAAGYDRDFDEILAGARDALNPVQPAGRADEVELDGRRLRLPDGVGLDLSGVVKGWTVDRTTHAALSAGLPWILVEAGGDLRLEGSVPNGGLEIAVEDPQAPDTEIGRMTISDGALATSCVTKRAWGPDLHHLIDPSTGMPAAGPVLQATVWAPTCAEAEVRSKDALLLGEEYLRRAPALLVLREGPVLTNFRTCERAA